MNEAASKPKKKKSLNKRMLVSVVIFAIVLVIGTGSLVCWQYYRSQMNTYSVMAYDCSRSLAAYVDGDKVLEYVETGEKDDYYYNVLNYINAAQKETGIKYYYVFVPYEDDLVYVWDATGEPGFCELGQHEDYMSDESKKATFDIMRQDPPEKISVQNNETYGYIASAYSPIFNSEGEAVAVAAVDMSIPKLRINILKFMMLVLITIMGITAVAQTLFYASIDRRVIQPIRKLTKSAGEVVDNLEHDKAVDINIKTGDEIEELANAVSKMDGDLKDYVKKLESVTAEKERIGAELNVAKGIQAGMLPRIFPPFPERTEFELYATMTPAKEVGGDFYDFYMVDDDHIALVMADVSGKGVPAALFMVVSKIFIKNSVQAGLSPADALVKVNDQLLEGNDSGLFVTVWLAVIDLRTGEGIAANAGHEHPVLMRAGGIYELVKYRHSPAVSTLEGIPFKEHSFKLEPGDSLFVYTDGVTEATNSDMQLYGEERLAEALNKNRDLPPDQLLPAIKGSIDEFVGEAPQFDDITMLGFTYNGNTFGRS